MRHVTWIVLAASAAVVLATGCSTQSVEPPVEPRPEQQPSFIARAVFADARLWLLSDHGVLSSIIPGQTVRRVEPLSGAVLGLCAQNGQPTILTCATAACDTWTLQRRSGQQWREAKRIPNGGDQLVALSCGPSESLVLATKHLFDVTPGHEGAITLSDELDPSLVTTVYATPETLFVGRNAGEWGGGLWQIDRRSGAIREISDTTDGGCNGSLGSGCDPVNGIARIPWQPDCIAVAVGLVHFFPNGRLVQVCDTRVRRLFVKPIRDPTVPPDIDLGERITEAFFGLTERGDVLWAVGLEGLYRIEAGPTVTMVPLPEFTTIDDVTVSFAVPELVLVWTDITQRRSVSSSVPLLVPR